MKQESLVKKVEIAFDIHNPLNTVEAYYELSNKYPGVLFINIPGIKDVAKRYDLSAMEVEEAFVNFIGLLEGIVFDSVGYLNL